MSKKLDSDSAPLSSLAAAAAKLSLTPTKVLDGTSTQKRLPSKQNERSSKERSRGSSHINSSNKATPRRVKGHRRKDTSSKRNSGCNKGGDSPKQEIPNQFEFYLNPSDSDDYSTGEENGKPRYNEKPKPNNHQKHRTPTTSSHRQNRRNEPSSIKRQQKESIRDGALNNGNPNGRIIDVNASRRLIGHALGKRIPSTDQNRQRKFELVNASKQDNQSQIKPLRVDMEYSSPSKTHSGPVLIPSSQLDGQIKVAEMKRWADDESSDED